LSFLELDERNEDEQYKLQLGDTHLSHHSNLLNPVNSKSIDKWRMALSEADLCKVHKIIKKTLYKARYC
jgi:hypothetical protein